MANDKKPEVVEVHRYRIRRLTKTVGDKEVPTDRYDVLDEVVRGQVVRQKKLEAAVSLPVARERWDRMKSAQAASDEGRI